MEISCVESKLAVKIDCLAHFHETAPPFIYIASAKEQPSPTGHRVKGSVSGRRREEERNARRSEAVQ